MMQKRKCDKCGKSYIPITKQQRYCQNPCSARTARTIEEANNHWLTRGPRKSTTRKVNISTYHYEY